jgi:hypothetical protein
VPDAVITIVKKARPEPLPLSEVTTREEAVAALQQDDLGRSLLPNFDDPGIATSIVMAVVDIVQGFRGMLDRYRGKDQKPLSSEEKQTLVKKQIDYQTQIGFVNAQNQMATAQGGVQKLSPAGGPCASGCDPRVPLWSASAKTFAVRATEFGGPSDMAWLRTQGGKTVRAPNVSAYNHRQWVPAGLEQERCECSLPARLPNNTWLAVRNPSSGKAVYCKVTDIGPKVTDDQYWKTNTDPRFPARALDMTRACWESLRSSKAPEGKRSGDVEWQFTTAPSWASEMEPLPEGQKNREGRYVLPQWKRAGGNEFFQLQSSYNKSGGWKWESRSTRGASSGVATRQVATPAASAPRATDPAAKTKLSAPSRGAVDPHSALKKKFLDTQR